MSNLDSRLDTSRSALTTDLESSIPSADALSLLKLARIANQIKQSENQTLEALIDSRAQTLISGANVEDLTKVAGAVAKVIDAVTPNTSSGAELPTQSGNANKWLTTDGTNMTWGDVDGITSSEYINEAGLPASGNTNGDLAYAVSEKSLNFWNGTAWEKIGNWT